MTQNKQINADNNNKKNCVIRFYFQIYETQPILNDKLLKMLRTLNTGQFSGIDQKTKYSDLHSAQYDISIFQALL